MLVISRNPGQSIVGQSFLASWRLTVQEIDHENQTAIVNIQTPGLNKEIPLELAETSHRIALKADIQLLNVGKSKVRIGFDVDESYEITRSELAANDGSSGLGNTPVPKAPPEPTLSATRMVVTDTGECVKDADEQAG